MLPGGVLEPRDVGALPAIDALVVRVGVVVALELHAPLAQLIDRRVEVVHREVEDSEGGRGVVLLRVDQYVPIAGEVQPSIPCSSVTFTPSVSA
jgi:hypothetical protein